MAIESILSDWAAKRKRVLFKISFSRYVIIKQRSGFGFGFWFWSCLLIICLHIQKARQVAGSVPHDTLADKHQTAFL